VSQPSLVLANAGFEAPSPADFELRDIFYGHQVLLTKLSLLLVLGAILAFVFLRVTSYRAAVVPSRVQYLGEQFYSYVRNGIAQDSIGGQDYSKYVALLVSLFSFLLINNCFGIVPVLQMAPFSRVGFAYGLAALVWIIYNSVGVARHGFVGYLKHQTKPAGVPSVMLLLIVPLEFLSNILVRPITLSLRLFANMFSGHLLLLLFASGAQYLLFDATGSIVVKPAGALAFILGILVGLLEFIVEVLQAYVFTLLTAQYIGGALASEH
jgi:F-type H+-transporting ATPase subunit a